MSVCVVQTRDNVRLKGLSLENTFSTHIMGLRPIENFLQASEGQGFDFFHSYPVGWMKFRNFRPSKISILEVKMTFFIFVFKHF